MIDQFEFKRKILLSFSMDFIINCFLYFGIPIYLGFIWIQGDVRTKGFGWLILLAIVYIYNFMRVFKPQLLAVFDLIFMKSQTEKFVFLSQHIDYSKSYFLRSDRTLHNRFQFLLSGKSKRYYLSEYEVKAERGCCYTVEYSRFARIVLSFKDKNGVELLNVK